MVRLSSPRAFSMRAFAALALVASAACSDNGTSPLARAEAPQANASRAAGYLHTGKYRDSGAPHATGRSGSARLEARAIVGADGVVRLLVTTGSVSDPENAPGELARVQLKAFGADGEPLWTENHQRFTTGGSYEFRLPGLARGARVQVQANVRGIDRRRTDVVTITESVKRAPSLDVRLDPPSRVIVGSPAVISASVSETGGDAGAYAACVLYVDGVEVDRIARVWVDAGDVVSCAFTHTFRQPGTHEVEVRMEADGANQALVGPLPSASTRVDAINANPAPSYTASAVERTVAVENRWDEFWTRPDGMTRRHEQRTGDATRTQTVSVVGSVARAAAFPMAVTMTVESDAAHWVTETWPALEAAAPDSDGRSCASRFTPEQGSHFYLCSTGQGIDGATTFGYTRFSGTVTYHSVVFGRMWDAVTSTETLWSWNDVYETYGGGGQHRVMGSEIRVGLEMTDAVGPIRVTAAIPLRSFDTQEATAPYTCREERPYWLNGGVQTLCTGSTQRTYGLSGEVTG